MSLDVSEEPHAVKIDNQHLHTTVNPPYYQVEKSKAIIKTSIAGM